MAIQSGSLTSIGDTVTLTGNGEMSAIFSLSGTFSLCTIVFEVSPTGVEGTWFQIAVLDVASGSTVESASLISSAKQYQAAINGMQCRARLTAKTSITSLAVRIEGLAIPIGAVMTPPAVSTSIVSNGAPATALAAAAANGSGTAIDYTTCRRSFGIQYVLTGSPSGGTVTLEGSLDGTNFFTLGTVLTIGTDASGCVKWAVDKPVRYVRATLASLAGGTTPTVTAYICAAG